MGRDRDTSRDDFRDNTLFAADESSVSSMEDALPLGSVSSSSSAEVTDEQDSALKELKLERDEDRFFVCARSESSAVSGSVSAFSVG